MTHEWEKLYEAAMLETDWSRMEERIEAAESALHVRLDEVPLEYGSSLEETELSLTR